MTEQNNFAGKFHLWFNIIMIALYTVSGVLLLFIVRFESLPALNTKMIGGGITGGGGGVALSIDGGSASEISSLTTVFFPSSNPEIKLMIIGIATASAIAPMVIKKARTTCFS